LQLKPGGLWFQLANPVEQQDGKEQGEKTEGNTGCVHKGDLFGEVCSKRAGQASHSLKSLRWENFRWTGLGQKT